ncbi:MAG: tRNA-dihydrouridine synthase [Syntrophobacteraceae bacterium]
MDFWQTLTKPIFALAPLSGITDSAFRRICKQFGADVVYSELASTAALAHNPGLTLEMLRFEEVERPYVVQLFGNNPEFFAKSARRVTDELRPDGIDINFGCPVPKVTKQGAGAALMTNLPQAREVIQAVVENTHLPVSVKARIKVRDVEIAEFLEYVGDLDLKALMLHGRTYAQRFSGPNEIERTRAARTYFPGVVLANGGANSAENGIDLLQKTGADGLGIARGALGRPWIFRELKAALNGGPDRGISGADMTATALLHARLSEALKGRRGILEMRKHLCWYIQNIPNAGKIRQRLSGVNSLQEIAEILEGIEGLRD